MNHDLPDHPVISNMERTGYPAGKEPAFPHCPVCNEECNTLFADRYGEVFACDMCVREKEAWETPECFPKN